MNLLERAIPNIKHFFKRADIVLLVLCVIASVFGLVVISSATKTMGSFHFMFVQTFALVLGIFLFVLFTIIDIDVYADRWPILIIGSVLFMCSLFIWGQEESGNKGWLRFMGIGIQPSEIVKVIYVVVMAKHIAYLKEYKNLNALKSVVQLAVHFIFMFGVVYITAEDFGSALIFFFIFIVMLWIAGLKWYWILAGIGSITAVFPIVWNKVFSEIQRNRILAPYVDSIDPTGFGTNWQLSQSKIALASGQFMGTGLYNGTQSQSDAISAKQTDFIFAVVGEELGMIGCCAVFILLLLIIARCVYIGIKSGNTFNMLVCFGMAAFLTFQTFINIGMCIGLAPVIGLTLPFFSYGGSSLFSTLAAMGIVSGIKYKPKPSTFSRL